MIWLELRLKSSNSIGTQNDQFADMELVELAYGNVIKEKVEQGWSIELELEKDEPAKDYTSICFVLLCRHFK